MRPLLVAACLAATPLAALAGVDGVWRTEANRDGDYLEVTVGACASDADKVCGTITRAFTSAGENPNYVNLGKPIIENMTADDATSFSGGTIWDPENGRTFKAKMKLAGDELDVEGCVAIICEGQAWQRVE